MSEQQAKAAAAWVVPVLLGRVLAGVGMAHGGCCVSWGLHGALGCDKMTQRSENKG